MHYITDVTYNLRPIQLIWVKKKHMEDIFIISITFIQKKKQQIQQKSDSSHEHMDTITYTSSCVAHLVYLMTPACLVTFPRTPWSVHVDYT
jgi:transcriptional antiterminator